MKLLWNKRNPHSRKKKWITKNLSQSSRKRYKI